MQVLKTLKKAKMLKDVLGKIDGDTLQKIERISKKISPDKVTDLFEDIKKLYKKHKSTLLIIKKEFV